MKDVSRRVSPRAWAGYGALLGLCFGFLCCGGLVGIDGLTSGQGVEFLVGGLVTFALLGVVGGHFLALLTNIVAPSDPPMQLPASLEEAARERFNARAHKEGVPGAGGPDERVAPDREGLKEAE
jgi:hypothetical protein